MATTIAILIGETEKAYKLLCGKPAKLGWIAKSICRTRPQHLFYVEWDNVERRSRGKHPYGPLKKVYAAIEIDIPSWALKQNGWMQPIGTPQVLARFKTELNSMPASNPPAPTPEEDEDLDRVTEPWWNRD